MKKNITMFYVKYKLDKDNYNGIGVFILEDIKKGINVISYDEEWIKIIDINSIDNKYHKEFIMKHGYDGNNHTKYGLDDNKICIDLDDSRFVNHSDKPSLKFNYITEMYESTRDLYIGDELTMDYREFCTIGKYCAAFLGSD